jgi:hypothetical protein
MNDKRQKNQLQRARAFTEEGRSEAPRALREGTESCTAKRETESPAREEQLMEEVCGRENCQQALGPEKANKGSPGIDGMKVSELPGYLKQHWPAIREQLLSGTYPAQPVRRVQRGSAYCGRHHRPPQRCGNPIAEPSPELQVALEPDDVGECFEQCVRVDALVPQRQVVRKGSRGM